MINQSSVFNEFIITAMIKAWSGQRDKAFIADVKLFAEECLDDESEKDNPSPADILQSNVRKAILQFVEESAKANSECDKFGQHQWFASLDGGTDICECGAWK